MSEYADLPEELRTFACQKLRHEYGHLVSARVMGFQTGEVALKLIGKDRHHRARAELFVHVPLRDTAGIIDYLERRVIVLFSGALAEASSIAEVGGKYVEEQCFKSEGGARDQEKIFELIALHQNISRPDSMEPNDVNAGRQNLYASLRTKAAKLVGDEFELIDGLASDHVAELKPNSHGWSWGLGKAEVDALARIAARFR
jgi:hypothetical protein